MSNVLSGFLILIFDGIWWFVAAVSFAAALDPATPRLAGIAWVICGLIFGLLALIALCIVAYAVGKEIESA